MSEPPLVRDISDTALWVAYYRAQETDRPDALFKDPYARALAGERGARIAKAQTFGEQNAWSFMARTVLFDRFISEAVRAGADTVVNLAAGLDTRPYRMALPPALRWVEVDLPGILDYKETILGDAAPVCRLERVRLDLSDRAARRALFDRLASAASRVAIVTEGLLIYLEREEAAQLARDLAAPPPFRTWIADLVSPALVKMMNARGGDMVAAAGAPFKFAPPEGPAFFQPLGWTPVHVGSLLKTAGKLHRLPPLLKLISFLPEGSRPSPGRPWSAVLQLERT
jgi:methyltransferase (TIGR00027 family)